MWALRDVSMSINNGEFVCVTGPSGSGKSTLLNILGCLDRPTGGSYRFAGHDVEGFGDRELARLRRLVFGFVFQDYGLLDSMTALRNVALPAEYAGIRMQESNRQAEVLLRSLDLENRQLHMPAELSGGEQQRVAIARALMNGRRIILADEPTGALDSQQSEQILSLFRELASRGNTVVLVSHDTSVAATADRRIELLDGSIVGDSGMDTSAPKRPLAFPAGLEPKKRPLSRVAEAFRMGIDALRAGRLRTALLLAGAALGVSSAITLLGLANGTYQASLMVMGSLGADRVGVGQIAQPGIALMGSEEARSVERLANVREAALSQVGETTVRRGDRNIEQVWISGLEKPPEFMYMQWPLALGQYITRQDGEENLQVALLGPRLRNLLFAPGEDPLGAWINVGGIPFEVRGILAPHPILQGENYRSQPPPPMMWVPYSIGRELLFRDSRSVSLTSHVRDISRLEETAAEIRDVLIRHLGHDQFLVTITQDIVGAYRDSVRLRIRVLTGIAVASLLAGAAVTMALMFSAIRQRAREIAIRIAVGARRNDILRQFVAETSVIILAGTIFGAPLGLIAGYVVNLVVEAPSAYESWFFWAATASAVFVGLASSVLPARRASRLDPVAALSDG